MRLRLILSVLPFLPLNAFSQQLQWVAQLKGSTFNYPAEVSIDNIGKVYSTGYFEGQVDFDPGDAAFGISSNGKGDGYVSKLNEKGQFIWAKSFKGREANFGTSIVADAFGNVYTTGKFNGTVNLSTGQTPLNFTSSSTYQFNYDYYLTKLDSSGNTLWAKSLGLFPNMQSCKMVVDDSGYVYVGGTFGNSKNAIRRYRPNGDVDWERTITTPNTFNIYSMDVNKKREVFIGGTFSGKVDFDPNEDSVFVSNLNDIENYSYLLKLDANGKFKYAKKFGGSLNALKVNEQNDIFLMGRMFYTGKGDYDPSDTKTMSLPFTGKDVYFLKLDSLGNLLWAHTMATVSENTSISIVSDKLGNAYVTGTFENTINLNPKSTGYIRTSKGSTDIYYMKFEKNGTLLWAEVLGSSGQDFSRDLKIDAEENLYLAGSFRQTVDFDPSPISQYNLTAAYSDIFVMKIGRSFTTEFDQTSHVPHKVSVFPNPAQHYLSLNGIEGGSEIEITNAQGQQVLRSNSIDNRIDISFLPFGVYCLRVGEAYLKFVKQ